MYTKYLFLIKNCQYTYNGNFRLKSSFVINNGANILFSNNRQYSQKIQYPRNLDFIEKKKTVRNYAVAIGILTLGVSFAAVPLYRIFCQVGFYVLSFRILFSKINISLKNKFSLQVMEEVFVTILAVKKYKI